MIKKKFHLIVNIQVIWETADKFSTIPQNPPSRLKNYSTRNSARLKFPKVYIHALIHMNGAQKIVSSAGVRTYYLPVIRYLPYLYVDHLISYSPLILNCLS